MLVITVLAWMKPWKPARHPYWERIIAEKGSDYVLIHDMLIISDAAPVRAISREEFQMVVDGTSHNNPEVWSNAFATIARFYRNEQFQTESKDLLESMKSSGNKEKVKQYLFIAMLARLPGIKAEVESMQYSPDPELAKEAVRVLKFDWEKRWSKQDRK
jgi:hypothetical protein